MAKKWASVESFHDFAWSIKREAVFKRLVVLSTPWPGTLVRETSLKPWRRFIYLFLWSFYCSWMCVGASAVGQTGRARLTEQDGPSVDQLLNTWQVFIENLRVQATLFIFWIRETAAMLLHQTRIGLQRAKTQTGGNSWTGLWTSAKNLDSIFRRLALDTMPVVEK